MINFSNDFAQRVDSPHNNCSIFDVERCVSRNCGGLLWICSANSWFKL